MSTKSFTVQVICISNPRHGHMLRCEDCLAFAESLTEALPHLDPGIFRTLRDRQSLLVTTALSHSDICNFIFSALSIKCRGDGSKI